MTRYEGAPTVPAFLGEVLMLDRFKHMTANDWLFVASWTALGTLGCILSGLICMRFAFSELGQQAVDRASLSAIIMPLLLAPPLFLVMTLKVIDLRHANARLRKEASTDSLTDVLNRGAFASEIDRYLDRPAPPTPYCGALLVIDADNFKSINDRFGHHHGDEALTIIARSIRAILRTGDVVGRLGGEEFGVFLPDVDMATARSLAERIRKAINLAVFTPGGQMSQLSVSVGGAVFEREIGFTELFRQADRSLYQAKRFGRNRVEVVAAAHLKCQGAAA